jgi:type II secretory pathway component PulJ
MTALTNAQRQAVRQARYRAMQAALETIRRDCPDAETRRQADAALVRPLLLKRKERPKRKASVVKTPTAI